MNKYKYIKVLQIYEQTGVNKVADLSIFHNRCNILMWQKNPEENKRGKDNKLIFGAMKV